MSSLNSRERRPSIATPRAILRIRLIGDDNGSIPLTDLSGLAAGVQETVLRLARHRANRSGPGRTPEELRDWIRLDATGIESGSAVLVVEAPGRDEQLPLEDVSDPGLEALASFEDALEAIGSNTPMPEDVDPLSEETIRTMLRRLSGYQRVEWSHEGAGISRRIIIDPKAVDATAEPADDLQPRQETLVGRLYQLNLRSHRYGIEDDLGRSIHCEFPRDSQHLEEIRQLIGRRIVLTGTAFRDETGDVARFEVNQISAADKPETTSEFFSFDLDSALSAVEPVGDLATLGIPELTEAEANDFWQALNE